MTGTGPLHGLRVLETATGVAGPYAGRLLAMLGATVIKVEPVGGDPSRVLTVDGLPQETPGPAFVHLNTGKRIKGPDADPEELLEWADVVLSSAVRSDFGPYEWRAVQRPPLLVSVTAWGIDALRAGVPTDELLVQAASGILDCTGGEGTDLHRFPGWQTQYLAGAYAAVGAMLGVPGSHVETSWLAAGTAAVEAQAASALYAVTSPSGDSPEEERRHAGFQARTFPSGVFACKDGFVVPGTVRSEDWYRQCLEYGREDLLADTRFVWARRWENRDSLRAEIKEWYEHRTRYEIFERGLDIGWSVGVVLDAASALTDRHLEARGFLTPQKATHRERVAARPWLEARAESPVPMSRAADQRLDLRGVRVIELTWAWAGPLAGRLLGAAGADVVRVESGRHPDGWRSRLRWSEAGAKVPPGVDPGSYTWDAAAQSNSVNRNKRAVSVDLSVPEGREVFMRMIDVADVLIVNMNYRMLEDRGLAQHVQERVNRGLVLLNMPALGRTGPYAAMPGFGMINEAMGGFAARYGDAEAGADVSPTYYPDAVAGVHAAIAVLAGLRGRMKDGQGRSIDLSQQETLWLQLGEGLVLASREGRAPRRVGDIEPGCAASGILRTLDGAVVFVASGEDCGMPGLADPAALEAWARKLPSDAVVAALTDRGAMVERVRSIRSMWRSDSLVDGELVHHPTTGTRGYLGIPLRLNGRHLATRAPAPRFDEHTDEVLTEWLGLGPGRLRALRQAEAIGTVPRQPRVRRSEGASTSLARSVPGRASGS